MEKQESNLNQIFDTIIKTTKLKNEYYNNLAIKEFKGQSITKELEYINLCVEILNKSYRKLDDESKVKLKIKIDNKINQKNQPDLTELIDLTESSRYLKEITTNLNFDHMINRKYFKETMKKLGTTDLTKENLKRLAKDPISLETEYTKIFNFENRVMIPFLYKIEKIRVIVYLIDDELKKSECNFKKDLILFKYNLISTYNFLENSFLQNGKIPNPKKISNNLLKYYYVDPSIYKEEINEVAYSEITNYQKNLLICNIKTDEEKFQSYLLQLYIKAQLLLIDQKYVGKILNENYNFIKSSKIQLNQDRLDMITELYQKFDVNKANYEEYILNYDNELNNKNFIKKESIL
ncbi:MAG: hypothetical protein ACK5HP_01890 [Bacilli bacterium]